MLRPVSEPRRVLIDWDYGAHGIWSVLTKEEEMEAPAPPGRWSGTPPPWYYSFGFSVRGRVAAQRDVVGG